MRDEVYILFPCFLLFDSMIPEFPFASLFTFISLQHNYD